MMAIPALDLARQYQSIRSEIDAAIGAVLATGSFILGEQVAAFEQEFAAFCGAEHAVGVGSGTEALHLALLALGIGPGDEVITVPHTAVATVAAIDLTGARPVLVDVDPQTMTMDPAKAEAAITENTKAILPVHLYGHPARLTALRDIADRRCISLVEDCAQAHGARSEGRGVGTVGELGCFSFYPTKNLGAYGDGGAIVTNNAYLAQRLRLLRQYGWQERYISAIRGGANSRLDEMQAAILRVKLRRLAEWNVARRERAAAYARLLAGADVITPVESPGDYHVYHLYVVRSKNRDALRAYLKERGVGTGIHYPVPVHLQPGYVALGRAARLPVAERLAGEILSLPMFPELTMLEVEYTARLISEFGRR
jgi:dTDP-4-amino-4,6-dideoxygalactose transaminase